MGDIEGMININMLDNGWFLVRGEPSGPARNTVIPLNSKYMPIKIHEYDILLIPLNDKNNIIKANTLKNAHCYLLLGDRKIHYVSGFQPIIDASKQFTNVRTPYSHIRFALQSNHTKHLKCEFVNITLCYNQT